MKTIIGCAKQTKVKVALCFVLVYIGIELFSLDLKSERNRFLPEELNNLEVFSYSPTRFAVVGNLTSTNYVDRKQPTCHVEKLDTTANLPLESSWESIEAVNQDILVGGSYEPKNCVATSKVAIIIPLRGREAQLRLMLSHMHPIWKRQMLEYQVYVIYQAGSDLFNRAKLLNIGVAEASKDGSYDCYVFHDVDLLLENEECLYSCEMINPRHISHHIDIFSYEPISYYVPCNPSIESLSILNIMFPSLYGVMQTQGFGGVSMMTAEQFKSVNGFSNLYWGWGGEDDDMFHRIAKQGYSVVNPYGKKCSFKMIKHRHESGNARNPTRYSLLRHAVARMEKEGFSSLKYRVVTKTLHKLYTNITVDIGKPSAAMLNFLTQKLISLQVYACMAKMPWTKEKDAQ